MKKRFLTIWRDPDTGNSGGSPDNSTATPAPAQAETVGSGQSSAPAHAEPTYDQAYFDGLSNRMDTVGYEPTAKELEAFEKFSRGEKVATEPSGNVPEKKPEATDKQPDGKPGPKSESDVEKLISEKSPNKWSEAEAKAVEDAMAKVGAKSPQDLLSKTQAALSLAGKKGQEAGAAQQEVAQMRERFDAQQAFLNDFLAGKPEALEFFQKQTGIKLGNQAGQQPQVDRSAPKQEAPMFDPNNVPEDVIDVEMYKIMATQFQKQEQLLKDLTSRLTGTEETAKAASERIQSEAQAKRDELVVREFRTSVIEQIQAIAEIDPETYKVESASLAKLMQDYYSTGGKVDPRIANHIELLEFAVKEGISDLYKAHTLKNAGRFTEMLARERQKGREEVLNQSSSSGLSAVRGKSQDGANPQNQYTIEDIRAIERNARPMPPEWVGRDGMLIRENIPSHLHQHIFG